MVIYQALVSKPFRAQDPELPCCGIIQGDAQAGHLGAEIPSGFLKFTMLIESNTSRNNKKLKRI